MQTMTPPQALEAVAYAAAVVGGSIALALFGLAVARVFVWSLGLLRQDARPREWAPADLKRLRKQGRTFKDGRRNLFALGEADNGQWAGVNGRLWGEIESDQTLCTILTEAGIDPDSSVEVTQ